MITTGHAYNIRDLRLPGALSGKTGAAEFGVRRHDVLPFHSWFVAYLPSRPGATDADLAVVTFVLGGGAGQCVAGGRQVLPAAVVRAENQDPATRPARLQPGGGQLMGAVAVTSTLVDNVRARRWRAFDLQLFLYVILLIGFGVVMGYSAGFAESGTGGGLSQSVKTLIWTTIQADHLLRCRQHRLPLAADPHRADLRDRARPADADDAHRDQPVRRADGRSRWPGWTSSSARSARC